MFWRIQLTLRPLFHVSGADVNIEKRWGYSGRPYQYPHMHSCSQTASGKIGSVSYFIRMQTAYGHHLVFLGKIKGFKKEIVCSVFHNGQIVPFDKELSKL